MRVLLDKQKWPLRRIVGIIYFIGLTSCAGYLYWLFNDRGKILTHHPLIGKCFKARTEVPIVKRESDRVNEVTKFLINKKYNYWYRKIDLPHEITEYLPKDSIFQVQRVISIVSGVSVNLFYFELKVIQCNHCGISHIYLHELQDCDPKRMSCLVSSQPAFTPLTQCPEVFP